METKKINEGCGCGGGSSVTKTSPNIPAREADPSIGKMASLVDGRNGRIDDSIRNSRGEVIGYVMNNEKGTFRVFKDKVSDINNAIGLISQLETMRFNWKRDAELENKPTFPQTIELESNNRIIVISGPNAGGKTISLKTIGLLQLMLQCGMLIPVHERSETFLFDRILTDIGDNQSIENHLSTYSYRLKNMNYFLKKCNDKTLFLIDEFGTGSDPELGGALAEIFLEEFYNREAFGIITTHYSNLKILANELPFAMNANMLFDEKSLEPMYKLVLGQAGSSFTFEVAQKNGIPYGLINRAKKKIEVGKVRFDKTIATLQKERSKMEKTSLNLKEEESKAREEGKKMETINAKIQNKLENHVGNNVHQQAKFHLLFQLIENHLC